MQTGCFCKLWRLYMHRFSASLGLPCALRCAHPCYLQISVHLLVVQEKQKHMALLLAGSAPHAPRLCWHCMPCRRAWWLLLKREKCLRPHPSRALRWLVGCCCRQKDLLYLQTHLRLSNSIFYLLVQPLELPKIRGPFFVGLLINSDSYLTCTFFMLFFFF